MNLIQSFLGSGIIIMPIALHDGTIVMGTVFMLTFCIVFGFTFWLLGEAALLCNAKSFRELWDRCFGPKFAWIIDLVLFLNALCACLGHMIALGDYMSRSLSYFSAPKGETYNLGAWWCDADGRWFDILVVCLVVIFPLSIFKKLGALRYTSTAGLFITMYVLIYLAVIFFEHSDTPDNLSKYAIGTFKWESWFASVFFSSAYSCHSNAPQLHAEFRRPTSKRFGLAVIYGFGACTIIFLLTGLFGVGRFGDDTEGIHFGRVVCFLRLRNFLFCFGKGP